MLKKWAFSVNDTVIFDKKTPVDDWDIVSRVDTTHGPLSFTVKTELTLTLYKPAWYVSSDVDEWGHPSRKQLLLDTPYERYLSMLHIAWRLDVDTEGLILVTSDGKLNHRIISPKRHLKKIYIVTCRDSITAKECTYLAKWVILEDWYKTKPALVETTRKQRNQTNYHRVKIPPSKTYASGVMKRSSSFGTYSYRTLDKWQHATMRYLWSNWRRTCFITWMETIVTKKANTLCVSFY